MQIIRLQELAVSAQHVYLCGHACLPQMGPSLHPYGFVKYLLLPSRFRNHSACLSIPCCQSMGRQGIVSDPPLVADGTSSALAVNINCEIFFGAHPRRSRIELVDVQCCCSCLAKLARNTVGVVNFALSALSNKPRYGVCSPGDHMMHSVGDATVAFVIYVF